ncbi:putative laccase precursor [Podospora australis]|uniref:Laccase n=1 Tax=Podospora australis TaxID=1536484 RepID=A0AAN6X328_9PEZI|nr:putative laccase precursor [Podospora australis]
MKVSAVVQSLLFFRGSHARGRALPFEDGPLQTPPDGGLDFEHLKRDSHEHEGYTDSPYINTTVLTDSPNPGHRGLTFHPVGAPGNFRCHYPHLDPATWESCNTADRRSCWIRSRQPGSDGRFYGYDIHSDYENAAPIGIPRYYTLDVAKHVIYPDGYPKNAILFNGTYPGPRIEACWGDQLVVTVINSLPNMGTQIHWHGLRQLFSNDMDGVPVTQCPIARGCSFVYKFRLLQYGTTWYHGHYSLQYVDGLRGPLVIHGPASSNYDLEVAETLLVTDWLYDTAFNVYAQQSMQPGARGVRADTILLNAKAGMNSIGGRGAAGPKDFAAYTVIRVVPGQRHRIRIINGAAGTAFVFSIDGHRLTVIAHDLVPIVPYITDSLVIGIGQRYDVIIGCPHGQIGNFWIRTHPADGCNQFRRGTFSSRTNPPSYPLDTRTGILSYSGHGRRSLSASSPNINTLPTTSAFPNISLSCYSHDQALHRPIVPRTVPQQPINPLSLSTFYTALQTYPSTVPFQRGNYVRWLLRLNSTKEFLSGQQMHTPFSISYSNPTLLNLTRAASNPSYNIVNYPYRKGNNNNNNFGGNNNNNQFPGPNPPFNNNNNAYFNPPISHPLHWHGHDVLLLAASPTPFDPILSPLSWNYNNPPRRDTIMVPAGGYVAVALRPNNPGVWLVHCHIAWHSSAGLALQMVIQDSPTQIHTVLGRNSTKTLYEGCHAWNRDLQRSDLPRIFDKVDSGI